MLVIQTKLRSGNTHMTTFLPVDKRVKPGKHISLEDVDGIWEVVEQFGPPTELHAINRGWNNNI